MSGHDLEAFTGADGRLEQAHKGTIFLDEIGDMTLSTPAKLRRLLQERSVQRVGGREPISFDVRVITATHRDLRIATKEKQFRENLFYRLNVVCITLPPLRNKARGYTGVGTLFLEPAKRQDGH
jgi:transcriptional regulator with GAF, ATPase, and Fis domain